MNTAGSVEPMRILMLVSDAHGGFGGIARHNCDVLESLSASGVVREFTVLPRVVGEQDFGAPPRVIYDLDAARGAGSFIRACLRHGLAGPAPDLIHCAHINLMPLAQLLGTLRRLPVLLVIHGIEAWSPPTARLTRIAARGASWVVSVSHLSRERFCAWSRFDAKRVSIVPNSFCSGSFEPGTPDPALVRALGLVGRKVVMTLGRMAPEERYKGFDEMIELMPRLKAAEPDLVYLACGDGRDRKRLEAKAAELGVAEAVRFTGFVPEERKADYYRLADAFVLPGSGEGFGIVILEALACGVPVVASALDASREAVRDGELGLVCDPRDPDALAASVLAAIQKPKGVPPGLAYFSRDRFAQRWQEAIKMAVRTGTSSAAATAARAEQI